VKPEENTISEYSDFPGLLRPSNTPDQGDYSVLSLNRRVSEFLSTAFPDPVWVRGEVAQVSKKGGRGHIYFRLAEPSPSENQPLAVIDCALFAGNRPLIAREFARAGKVFDIDEGTSVRVKGRITLWDKGGRYQLIVEMVDPLWTEDARGRKLQELVNQLRKEGILESNSQLPLSPLPLNIGLVTAKGSAAAQDFIRSLEESGYPFRVHVAWSPMQGPDTRNGVISAFNRLLSLRDLDAVVLTRGGGSATDLAWFNDEHIARVISQVPWPVISGIGHETDSTLPDFVSGISLKTPTQCAAFLINSVSDFSQQLDSLAHLLVNSAQKRISRSRHSISSMAQVLARSTLIALRGHGRLLTGSAGMLHRAVQGRLAMRRRELKHSGSSLRRVLTAGYLSNAGRELNYRLSRLRDAAFNGVSRRKLLLQNMEARVSGNDPVRLYRRGWATVTGPGGKPVASIGDTAPDDRIGIKVRDGRIDAVTRGIVPEGNGDNNG